MLRGPVNVIFRNKRSRAVCARGEFDASPGTELTFTLDGMREIDDSAAGREWRWDHHGVVVRVVQQECPGSKGNVLELKCGDFTPIGDLYASGPDVVAKETIECCVVACMRHVMGEKRSWGFSETETVGIQTCLRVKGVHYLVARVDMQGGFVRGVKLCGAFQVPPDLPDSVRPGSFFYDNMRPPLYAARVFRVEHFLIDKERSGREEVRSSEIGVFPHPSDTTDGDLFGVVLPKCSGDIVDGFDVEQAAREALFALARRYKDTIMEVRFGVTSFAKQEQDYHEKGAHASENHGRFDGLPLCE